MCHLFELFQKGLSTEKKLCFGQPSEGFKKQWKNGIDELDGRYRDLLFKKLFNSMDNFWCNTKYVEVDVFWLLTR